MSRLSAIFQKPILLLYMLPAFLLGLTLHEWGHAFAAYRLGDSTAKNFGRLSVNPMDHIDPLGCLCLLLLGFGWAKPVPINSRNFSKPRRDELIVSLAGITMNLLEVIVFSVLFVVLLRTKPDLYYNEAFRYIFSFLITVNTSLAVFNLIPIPPLDGSHVLECILGGRLGYRFRLFMQRYGRFILLALLWLGVLDYPIQWAQNLVDEGINLLWRLWA